MCPLTYVLCCSRSPSSDSRNSDRLAFVLLGLDTHESQIQKVSVHRDAEEDGGAGGHLQVRTWVTDVLFTGPFLLKAKPGWLWTSCGFPAYEPS